MTFGLTAGLPGVVWQRNAMIGLAVGGTMLFTLIGAAICDTLLPLGSRLFTINSALAYVVPAAR